MGRQKGSLFSVESIALTKLKKGSIFYSHKKDKDITAIASYYKKKVKTERLHAINVNWKIEEITKITLL